MTKLLQKQETLGAHNTTIVRNNKGLGWNRNMVSVEEEKQLQLMNACAGEETKGGAYQEMSHEERRRKILSRLTQKGGGRKKKKKNSDNMRASGSDGTSVKEKLKQHTEELHSLGAMQVK